MKPTTNEPQNRLIVQSPPGWVPIKGGTIKYPVRNLAVRRYLRHLLPGRSQKVIKKGHSGDMQYFEHASGQVAGVKRYPN